MPCYVRCELQLSRGGMRGGDPCLHGEPVQRRRKGMWG